MKAKDVVYAKQLSARLWKFNQEVHSLPGLSRKVRIDSLVGQIVESRRRVAYIATILDRDVSSFRADPADGRFDPIRAAIYHQRSGNLEEAFWLVFLFVHFGKHLGSGWSYLRSVYGRLGDPALWTWERVSSDATAFRQWLEREKETIKEVGGGFGNHRKYESLSGLSGRGTGAAVASYVAWVAPQCTHANLIELTLSSANRQPRKAFDDLYRQMDSVMRFGRTAKFDYLTMLGKLKLADIEPGAAYLASATGPLRGVKLLFEGNPEASASSRSLEQKLATLDEQIPVGMQVWEDSLCNWQKSPNRFRPFRG